MDNLALDAKMALQAGMSYGKWKAMNPATKEREKAIDVSGMRKMECPNCGITFYTKRHNKRFCSELCRYEFNNRTRRVGVV